MIELNLKYKKDNNCILQENTDKTIRYYNYPNSESIYYSSGLNYTYEDFFKYKTITTTNNLSDPNPIMKYSVNFS